MDKIVGITLSFGYYFTFLRFVSHWVYVVLLFHSLLHINNCSNLLCSIEMAEFGLKTLSGTRHIDFVASSLANDTI